MDRNTLLRYCAYAIAIFDFLCALLFCCLSMGMLSKHLSWLTIFAVCFGVFWLSLIGLLITGIYWYRCRFVRLWIMFSCVGIWLEMVLIMYAVYRKTSFDKGCIKNLGILILGLFVEFVFVYIVYQFYKELSYCNSPDEVIYCKGKSKCQRKRNVTIQECEN